MPVIRVSFKETSEEELKLYKQIKEASVFVGDSGWMKQAAAEKLGYGKKEENVHNVMKKRRNLGDIEI